MKQTLNFENRNSTETSAKMVQSGDLGNWIDLRQVNGMGRISEVGLTFKEANELREWLNKNLPR